jgi:hypothetical protein
MKMLLREEVLTRRGHVRIAGGDARGTAGGTPALHGATFRCAANSATLGFALPIG